MAHSGFFQVKYKSRTRGQSIGNLAARRCEQPLNGSAGNPHPNPSLFLKQPLKIAKTQYFQFIAGNGNLTQFLQRSAGRFKRSVAKLTCTASVFLWARRHHYLQPVPRTSIVTSSSGFSGYGAKKTLHFWFPIQR